MSKIIIGIHGLNNKPPKAYLEQGWKKAILEGLEKNENITHAHFEFELIYWADLLYKVPMHNDGNYPFDDLYNQWPYVPLPPGEKPPKYNEGFLDHLRSGASKIVGAKFDWLKERSGPHAKTEELLGKSKFNDLALYYDTAKKINNRQQRPEAVYRVLRDEVISTLLRHSHREILFFAHSMGSIIAYDALREMKSSHPTVTIPRLFTAGSPLGLFFIKVRNIEEFGEKLCTPENITRSWHNYADKQDIVAVDSHLKDDYVENANGVRVQDDLIFNSYRKPKISVNSSNLEAEEETGPRDNHNVYGYLRTPEFSEQVKDFLNL